MSMTKLGQGPYWDELSAGQTFETFRRTITEADLIGFIGVTGMLEVLFIDENCEDRAVDGRLVPAALTYSIIEGMQMQSLVQGTGLAMLEMEMEIHAPVCVGDSIHAVVKIDDVRPTSRHNRAVVKSTVSIFKGKVAVMTYRVARLIAGKP